LRFARIAAKLSAGQPAERLFIVRVGIPKEVKADEYRVAMMPVGADVLVKAGHEVFIESDAGIGSGFPDEAYTRVGA
jgi:alanine dehydrogenase